MGQYADAIYDGTCCQECGVFIDDSDGLGEAFGVPRFCSDCGGNPEDGGVTKRRKRKHVRCHCGKKFATREALGDHQRAVHR